MKKAITIILMSLLFTMSVYANDNISIDGYQLDSSSPVLTVNDRTLVPMRDVFTAVGSTVDWNQETKQITAQKGNNIIVLTLNNKVATKNGGQVTLDTAPMQKNGVTYVPLRFVTEAFGAGIEIDEWTKGIKILTGDKEMPPLSVDAIAEQLGLLHCFDIKADLNNDGVLDFIIMATYYEDDGDEIHIASDQPYDFIVVDGKSGRILEQETKILPVHQSRDMEQASIKLKMVGHTPRLIYNRGGGKKHFYDFENGVFRRNRSVSFFKNNELTVDKENLNTFNYIGEKGIDEVFGPSTDEWFGKDYANYPLAVSHDEDEIFGPYLRHMWLFPGSEFMGLDFSETPAQVRAKLGTPVYEGILDIDQVHILEYDILWHTVHITYPLNPAERTEISAISIWFDSVGPF